MSTQSPAPPRRDASMSLLTDLLTHSLDEGYAQAAARRTAEGAPAGGRRRSLLAAIGLLAIGLVITTAAVITHTHRPGQLAARQQLLAEIDARQNAAATAESEIAKLEAEITVSRARALAETSAGQAAAVELDRLGVLAGVTPLRGPGLEVVVEDADTSPQDAVQARNPDQADPGTVKDVDLQRVANGLFAAGAEAVAINGQRLTSLSAIREAGGAILVNYRWTVSPYHVQAIGDPAALQTRFAQGEDGRYLHSVQQNWGVRYSIRQARELTLPGSPAIGLQWAARLPSTGEGGHG